MKLLYWQSGVHESTERNRRKVQKRVICENALTCVARAAERPRVTGNARPVGGASGSRPDKEATLAVIDILTSRLSWLVLKSVPSAAADTAVLVLRVAVLTDCGREAVSNVEPNTDSTNNI